MIMAKIEYGSWQYGNGRVIQEKGKDYRVQVQKLVTDAREDHETGEERLRGETYSSRAEKRAI